MGVVRKTKSIELLLNEFKTQKTAISTIELIKRLKAKLNKTTIYRMLENLVDDGILHTFMGHDGIKWYAMCINCTNLNMRIYIPILNVLNVVKSIV